MVGNSKGNKTSYIEKRNSEAICQLFALCQTPTCK